MDTIIELKDVGKIYKNKNKEVIALEQISLDITKGEIFGIIGMSGAGKSTLVRCINYLEKPSSGTVLFDGKDLSLLTSKELNRTRHSIGMIFQQFHLLMQRNSLHNICFPLEITGVPKKQAEKRARELLEIVGLTDKADVAPAKLSGGQKQRVAIARALATNPKVLLCDEATSALDPTTTRSILSLLKDINQRLGITIVIITHEMSVIEEICQRVAIIDQHRIVEMGTVEAIFSKPASAAAKKLVYPDGREIDHPIGTKCCRIVFDGRSSYEPVMANMILECKEPVNILFANTKNIDGNAFGQIVIQLPQEEQAAKKILRYLKEKHLVIEEVENYV